MAAAAVLATLATASGAQAQLGGQYASVVSERGRFGASLKSMAAINHTVHSLTLSNGTVVREFARPDGQIFAVAWKGPGKPNLHQLLGPQYQTMQNAYVARGGRRMRAPLTVSQSNVIIRAGGHPGGFSGYALLTKSEPEGFEINALK